MSVWAKKWAYEQRVGSSGAKAVLVALAEFANEDGFCYPSQPTLAAMTEIKERTIRAHLAYLEEKKFIRRESRRGEGGKWTSDGHTLLAPPAALKPPAPAYDAAEDSPAAKSAARPGSQRQNLPPVQRQDSPAAKSAAKPLIESDEPSGEKLSLRAREAVKVYASVYGHDPHLDGQTEIEGECRSSDFDLTTWREVVKQCRGNRTPDKNVGTMLTMYRERRARASPRAPSQAPPGESTAAKSKRLEDEIRGKQRTTT